MQNVQLLRTDGALLRSEIREHDDVHQRTLLANNLMVKQLQSTSFANEEHMVDKLNQLNSTVGYQYQRWLNDTRSQTQLFQGMEERFNSSSESQTLVFQGMEERFNSSVYEIVQNQTGKLGSLDDSINRVLSQYNASVAELRLMVLDVVKEGVKSQLKNDELKIVSSVGTFSELMKEIKVYLVILCAVTLILGLLSFIMVMGKYS